MSQIKFVAYLAKTDSGSALFRSHYDKLPAHCKAEIKVLDFHQIKEHYGASCPSWLKGYPVVATYSSQPTIWEGSKAIELVASWAQQQAPAATPSGPPQMAAPAQPAAAPAAPAAGGGAAAPDFAPMSHGDDFNRACAVVSDDLYQSVMPNKMASASLQSGSKVTSSEIARYTSQRGAAQPTHASRGGHMPM